MTTREAIKKYHKIEIELLLAHVLKKPKEFFYMNPEYELSSYQVSSLSSLVKRREKGEPVAYILGYKDFMGLRFKINRNVLIPRPETEWVVQRVMQHVAHNTQQRDATCVLRDKCKILDVGTGSGCIAVSLAKKFSILNSKFSITASDVSSGALRVARQNAKAHKVKIKFIKSDLLQSVKGSFDIIIANLPYVPESDYKSLAKDLKFEPKSAIFQKEYGLYLIRRLLEQVTAMKILPKILYLEFDPRQKQKLAALIKKSLPGSKTKFYKDYNNFWRFAEIAL